MYLNSKAAKERSIENYLRLYYTYVTGVKNCEQQLEYIMPSLVTRYEVNAENGETFFIVNNTEKVALDRIESKRAIILKEQIEQFNIIINSIDNAMNSLSEIEKQFVILRYFECKPIAVVTAALGYAEEKSIFKLRRHVLDKFLISLNNLLSLK